MSMVLELAEKSRLIIEIRPRWIAVGATVGDAGTVAAIVASYEARDIQLVTAAIQALQGSRRLPAVCTYDDTVQIGMTLEPAPPSFKQAFGGNMIVAPVVASLDQVCVTSSADFEESEYTRDFRRFFAEDKSFELLLIGPDEQLNAPIGSFKLYILGDKKIEFR